MCCGSPFESSFTYHANNHLLSADEQFSVTVMNAQEEKLTIVCLDRDLVGADDFLGVVTMDVSEALSVCYERANGGRRDDPDFTLQGAPKWYDFTEGSGQIKLAITFTSSAKVRGG